MIPQDLSDHLLHVIAWNRTWLAGKDFGNIGEAVLYKDGSGMVRFRCRMLRLEVRIAHAGFRRLQLLSVPEFAIEDAMKELSRDAAFRRRLVARQLTYGDVNEIIRIASDDTISLELDA